MNTSSPSEPAITAPSIPVPQPRPAGREDYNPLVHGKPKTMSETATMMALVGRLEDDRFLPFWHLQNVNRKDRRRMKAAMRKVLGSDLYGYASAMYWRMRDARGTLPPEIEREPAGG